ncbi:MAG TPA: TetR/AcrR family transcriptional regulator [Candidatus Lokiarchaeia archaeon]|nr:TetR/AcrR family transcriptional regulator [Candidatus Lokiarchaeia archaeon]
MTERKSDRFEMIKKEKRSLYLLAAVKTFQEKGFHATTVKDITDAAGTSVGNFYRYFASKEEIFEVLVTQFHKLMMDGLQVLNEYEIPPIEVLKEMFRGFVKLFREQKEIGLIYIEQMGGISKDYREMRNRLQEQYISEVEKIITRIYKLIHVKNQNPRITALAWTTLFLEAFSWWARTEFELNEEEFVDSIVNFLVLGTMTVPRKNSNS